MALFKKKLNPYTFPLFMGIYFFVALNFTLNRHFLEIFSELDDFSIGFAISLPIFFIAAFTFIFSILSWPFTNRWLFPLLILLCATVSYAMFNYGTVFDYLMIQNFVETNPAEASSYLNVYSIAWNLILGVIPALYILLRGFEKKPILKMLGFKIGLMLASIAVIAAIAGLYYKSYASVGRNNSDLREQIVPTYVLYSGFKYINKTYFSEPIPYRLVGEDAKQKPEALNADKPTLMVFLLGETARANNYQRNGYERPTNQHTAGDDVVYFSNVRSCGTATAVSVPCMFSQLPKRSYSNEMAKTQDNLIDVMKRAGIDMQWVENDGGDKGVAKNIPLTTQDTSKSLENCNGSVCYDIAMFKNFDQQVAETQGNRVLFYHLIGSHGPTYYLRYPEEHRFFTPDCPRSDIENCTQEELVNTYDNTILYTDFIVHNTIEKVKALQDKFNVAVFYLSDHGESLGENGLYLHGAPYAIAPDYQTHIPMMFWSSEGFNQAKSLDTKCLENYAATENLSHDNLFSSILGIMDVETNAYDKRLDMFATCRQ